LGKKEAAMRFFETIRRNHSFHFFLLFLVAATIVLSGFGCSSSKETAQMQKPHVPSTVPNLPEIRIRIKREMRLRDETFIGSRLSATKAFGLMRRVCRKE
jgi:hypothetical protein